MRLVLLALLAAPAALAQPGVLDATFGDGVVVRAHFHEYDLARGVALQPDGRIVVGGYSGVLLAPPRSSDFLLARFLPDGTLDPTFANGVASAAFECRSLVRLPGGKLLIGGTSVGPGWNGFAIARYDADGARDPTFGDGGVAEVNVESFNMGQALAVQPDGKAVLAGYLGNAGDVVLVRVHGEEGGSEAVEPPAVPEALALSAPAPHPFREGARITLSGPAPQPVRVSLYDALGREVAALADGAAEAGAHALALDGRGLAAGVYVVRAEGAGGAALRRVVRY